MTNNPINDQQAKAKAKEALILNKVQPGAYPKPSNKAATAKPKKA